MSYYNPKIYNYSNLHEEDKNTVLENCTTIEKMEAEIRNEAIEDAKDLLKGQLIDFMVNIIDRYDENEEIKKIDTYDYFYGLKD